MRRRSPRCSCAKRERGRDRKWCAAATAHLVFLLVLAEELRLLDVIGLGTKV